MIPRLSAAAGVGAGHADAGGRGCRHRALNTLYFEA